MCFELVTYLEIDGANRDRTGDLLLANSAGSVAGGLHWGSMPEHTERRARAGTRWWRVFSGCA